MTAAIAIQRRRMIREHVATSSIERYRVNASARPINRALTLIGPGTGLRLLREGSPDFFSFAELVKSLITPEMTEMERAAAIYRFSTRYFYGAGVGFGGTEMTCFINGFGYSFCWGQADFQHLLYEAAGLRARSPVLKGHSSVEVFIDGRWRALDAYMRVCCPSPTLDGVATGAELHEHGELFDAFFDAEDAAVRRDYWSKYGPGGTYEPWQDSQAMTLNLRRGEELTIDYDRREAWCLAPSAPSDCINGAWRYRPPLDARHLEEEVEQAVNVVAGEDGLRAADPAQPALVEYALHSPYPLVTGTLAARFAGEGAVRVSLSTDLRKTWTLLADGPAGEISAVLDAHLSPSKLPANYTGSVLTRATVRHLLLKVEWRGEAVLHDVSCEFLAQIHARSVPKLCRGVNPWVLLGNDDTAAVVRHAWDEYPDFRVSNVTPLEGEMVVLSVVVHNRGAEAAADVPVRFIQAGTDEVLGETIIPRIAPGGAATARVKWMARMAPDRPGTHHDAPKRYVSTRIEAIVGAEGDEDDWNGVARAVLYVRPRPCPRFSETLIHADTSAVASEQQLTLRAALAHQPQPASLVYQVNAPLSAILTPFLGHPDEGGMALAAPVHLVNIQPSEFAVAEWCLSSAALPTAFTLWVEARCDDAVLPEHRRLLACTEVRLDEAPGPARPAEGEEEHDDTGAGVLLS